MLCILAFGATKRKSITVAYRRVLARYSPVILSHAFEV